MSIDVSEKIDASDRQIPMEELLLKIACKENEISEHRRDIELCERAIYELEKQRDLAIREYKARGGRI